MTRHNEVWSESSEELPVRVSYNTDEGVIVRIEDKRTKFSSWWKFVRRVDRVQNDKVVHSYENMSEKSRKIFDYLSHVVDIHKDRMEVIEYL